MYQEISSPSSMTDFEETNAAFDSFHTPASLLGYINKPLPPIPDPKESKPKVSRGRHGGPKLSHSDPDLPLPAVEQLAPSFYLQPTTYSNSSLAVNGLEQPYQLADPSKPKSSETSPRSSQSAKERLYRDLGSHRANTDEQRVLTLKDMIDVEEQEQLDATDRQRQQQHMVPAPHHPQPNLPAPPEQISPLPSRAYPSSHSPESSSDYQPQRLIPPPLSIYKSPIPDRPVSRFSLNTTSSYSSDSPNHHHKANRSSLIAYLRKSASSSKTSKGKGKRKSAASSSSPTNEHFPLAQQKKKKPKKFAHLQQTIRDKLRYPYFSSIRPPPPPLVTTDNNPNPPHPRHVSAPATPFPIPSTPLSTRLNQRFTDGTIRLRGAIADNLRLPRPPHARREALKRRVVRVGEPERYVDGKVGTWV